MRAEFSRGALFKNVPLELLAQFYRSFHLVPLDQETMDGYCNFWVELTSVGLYDKSNA